jgi:hypothetical protein
MECEFCEHYSASVAVSKGTITQIACNICSAMLGSTWSVWAVAD